MIKKYFARANSAQGSINLVMNNIRAMDKLYILDGQSASRCTYLMKILLSHLENRFENIECMISPFNINHYDGIIIRDIKFAVCSANVLPVNTIGKHINTDDAENTHKLTVTKDDIACLSLCASQEYADFYKEFQKAKDIHDSWENLYISQIDFNRLNAYTDGVISQLVNKQSQNLGTYKYERFFGASTPDGSVNYIDNITKDLSSRYFIKGRPGTGKSTFLKKLLKAIEKNGYASEVYRCSLDTKSLDMVLCPELSFCVFDSTAPHEMFPEKERDKILDFYEEGALLGVDDKFENELAYLKATYSHRISCGLAHMRLGFLADEEREFYLSRATDFAKLDIMADKIIRSID